MLNNQRYLNAEHQVVLYATSECILKAEINTIIAAIGGQCFVVMETCLIGILWLDDYGASSPHAFKSSSFSIPTQCGYCQVCLQIADPLDE